MKMKWIQPVVALALVCSLTAAAPSAYAAGAEKIENSEKTCTLTVSPGGEDYAEDLQTADIVIDLYKVADAVEDPVYDTYSYRAAAPYQTLADTLEDQDVLTNSGWHALAQEAAKLTLDQGQTIPKAAEGQKAGEKIGGLEAGLYLLIARGEGIETYVTSVTEEDGTESLATVGYSQEYVYTFAPELVSLPGKAPDEEGNYSTANPGEWLYQMAVTLKPEQSVRFGSLEIRKSLPVYDASSGAPTFIFTVESTETDAEGKPVYSCQRSLEFEASGEQVIFLEDIPVGLEVTVTEIYSGASYSLRSGIEASQRAVIRADEVAAVLFINEYNASSTGGHGITNYFTYDGEAGKWRLRNSAGQEW